MRPPIVGRLPLTHWSGLSAVTPLFVGFLLLAGCSNDNNPAACSAPAAGSVRAPEGDSLCAARDTCSTSGEPDHAGCPNTCSCLCHEGLCYERTCTAVGDCSEPPVYR